MKIEIPLAPEESPKMTNTHRPNEAWVKRAIIYYLSKESGYTYHPGVYDVTVEILADGAIVTVNEKPKTEKEPIPINLSGLWGWLKYSVLRVTG